MRFVVIGLLLFTMSNTVSAQTTLPYTFAPGTVAKASEVNANFQALLTAINKLEGPVTSAGVAGTYVFVSLTLNVSSTGIPTGAGNTANIAHSATNATAVFNSDGTFSLPQGSSNGRSMNFAFHQDSLTGTVDTAIATAQPFASSPGAGGTWSLSGNTLTIAPNVGGAATFTAAAGGRLFVGVDSSGALQDLHFLIRTN